MTAPQTIRDTLYYGVSVAGGVYAELATDQSQYLDNQTVGASWHYEPSPASRFNVTAEWTVDVRFTANNADTGRLYNYSNIGLRLIAGGGIEPILNGGVLSGLTLPGIGAGGEDFLVSWSAEPNPDTTGAADAMRTELRAWNLTDGSYTKAVYFHAARTAGTADQIWWASSTGGLNALTGRPYACRFSSCFHTATETYEELVAASAPPTLAGEERMQTIVVPPNSTGMGDEGQYAGPIALMAAAEVAQNDLRLAGPIVNENYRSRVTHRGDLVGDEPFTEEDADDVAWGGTYIYLPFRHYRPVPPGANRVRVRVHIQQWRTVGDSDDLIIVAYSMNRPSFHYRPPTSPLALEVHRESVTRNADDGSGGTAGAWVTFDNLRIARDIDGWSYFMLGFRVEDAGGAGSIHDQLWIVKSFVVDPVFETADESLPGLHG